MHTHDAEGFLVPLCDSLQSSPPRRPQATTVTPDQFASPWIFCKWNLRVGPLWPRSRNMIISELPPRGCRAVLRSVHHVTGPQCSHSPSGGRSHHRHKFCLLQIKLLWTFVYKSLYEHAFISLGQIPRTGLVESCGKCMTF